MAKDVKFNITAKNKTQQAFAGVTKSLKTVSGAVFNFKTALAGVVGVDASNGVVDVFFVRCVGVLSRIDQSTEKRFAAAINL